MGRPQSPHKPFLFRMMSPKGSQLSPELLSLLNNFEETLAERIRKLKPTTRKDVFGLSWMRSAMKTLCEVHSDVLNLITVLELPVSNWDDKWIDVYLENSVKLLDICIAFSSEISRLKQGNLFLQCALHNQNDASEKQFGRACSSLDEWRHHVSKKNPRLDNCFHIIDCLVRVLDLPKVKNSNKGKVLMKAMYGVKVVTISICSILAAAFSGSAEKLIDLEVSETYLWAEAFTEMVNIESNTTVLLKEVEAVERSIKKTKEEAKCIEELRKSSEEVCNGLDGLGEEVDGFFRVILNGRDVLLSNLKVSDGVCGKAGGAVKNMGSPMVR